MAKNIIFLTEMLLCYETIIIRTLVAFYSRHRQHMHTHAYFMIHVCFDRLRIIAATTIRDQRPALAQLWLYYLGEPERASHWRVDDCPHMHACLVVWSCV